MRPFLCLAVLILQLTPAAVSQNLQSISWLSTAEKSQLQREGFIQFTAPTLQELPFLQRHPQRQQLSLIATDQGRRNLNIAVEGVFWLSYQNISPQAAQEKFFITTQAFSKMKGMTYFSQSRNRRETLILDIYRVESLSRPTRLNDRVWNSLAASSFDYFYQNDNTFGEGIYSMRVLNQFPTTQIVITNEQKIFWGIMPLVDPKHLYFLFNADFLADGILIYGFSGAQTFSLFGLERSREASFLNRLRALADWFQQNF